MKPLVLQGGSRPITYIQYNRPGDMLFTCCKDHTITVWWSDTGERIGVYSGHSGSVNHCDVTLDSKVMLSGGGEYAAKFWNIANGKCLATIGTKGPVRAVGISSDQKQFFLMTNPSCSLSLYNVPPAILALEEVADVPLLASFPSPATPTCATWMPLNRYICTGCEDGKLRFYDTEDPKAAPEVVDAHTKTISRICFNKTKSLFVTSSKDSTAKLFLSMKRQHLKTYKTPAPVNHAVISPLYDHVLCAGGQEARDVALTAGMDGHFELKFHHLIDEHLVGIVRGHFGTVNTAGFHPDGTSFATAGEDGFIRLHHFDAAYYRLERAARSKLRRAAGVRKGQSAAASASS